MPPEAASKARVSHTAHEGSWHTTPDSTSQAVAVTMSCSVRHCRRGPRPTLLVSPLSPHGPSPGATTRTSSSSSSPRKATGPGAAGAHPTFLARLVSNDPHRTAPQAGPPCSAAHPAGSIHFHPPHLASSSTSLPRRARARAHGSPLPPPLWLSSTSPRVTRAARRRPATDAYLLPPPLHSTPCTGPSSTNPQLNPRIPPPPPNARPLLGGAPRIRHRLRGRFGISRAPLPLLLRWL